MLIYITTIPAEKKVKGGHIVSAVAFWRFCMEVCSFR